MRFCSYSRPRWRRRFCRACPGCSRAVAPARCAWRTKAQRQWTGLTRIGVTNMQVILLERVGRLGQMGDVVTVKDGFARNYLLPQGKALRATEANRNRFERERAQLEARDLELKSEAQGVSGKLDGKSFIVIRQAGDTGQLYGSVSTRDIAMAVTEGGFSIERRQGMLDRPVKTLGRHDGRHRLA